MARSRLTKARGKDSIPGQVRRELERRGIPVSVTVEPAEVELRASFRKVVLHDRDHAPPRLAAHALRLVFAEPVTGPLALGWGAHYGLGRFEVAAPAPIAADAGC